MQLTFSFDIGGTLTGRDNSQQIRSGKSAKRANRHIDMDIALSESVITVRGNRNERKKKKKK